MKHRILICFFVLFFFPLYSNFESFNSLYFGAGVNVKKGIYTKSLSEPLGQAEVFKDQSFNYPIILGYEHFSENDFYVLVDCKFGGYKSKVQQVTDSIRINRANLFYQAKLAAGYTFDVGFDFMVTPSLGAGIASSNLVYNYSPTLPTLDAYVTRVWSFLIIGLNLDGAFCDSLDWGVHLQVLPNLKAAKLGVNIERINDLKLEEKINYLFSLPVTYHFSEKRYGVRIVPFYESQNFGSPKVNSSVPTDAFKNYVIGGQVEYIFRF